MSVSLVKQLIQIERKYKGYKFRRGFQEELERAMSHEYLHL